MIKSTEKSKKVSSQDVNKAIWKSSYAEGNKHKDYRLKTCEGARAQAGLVSRAPMQKVMEVTDDKVGNYISDDIALSILSKLPLKSLKRFECVRKSWSLLSDNPSFMSLYRHNFFSKYSYNDDTSLILHLHDDEKLCSLSGESFENMVELELPQQIDHMKFLGFGCANGILCFEEPLINKIVLWNPTTNELKIIPLSPFESFSPPATLNFDAPVSFVTYLNLNGFGYDYVADDYKLVRNTTIICKFHTVWPSDRDLLLGRDESLKPFWEIYSLKTNSWKKLDIDMPSCVKYNSGFGTFRVYLDGVNLVSRNHGTNSSLLGRSLGLKFLSEWGKRVKYSSEKKTLN
ncbi:hypothetical protein KIW84_020061 [Lathyrus oleraceus]|uniref:F-box associated beta-propeller type 1 domain-containing protein n=1 Tax=Pisum sativum TaxID=3888 RepID=A0A9D4Y5C6_PEA|nr:hypothetical protein KIW84_020061 [Pisum sativum]